MKEKSPSVPVLQSRRPLLGLYVVAFLVTATLIMGGVFYYSLAQRFRFQAEAGPLLRVKFLQTLTAREGQPVWRVKEQALPLNHETWDFSVNGRRLEVAVRIPVPIENQAGLTSEIINTVRLLLNLEPSNTKVDVVFRNSPSHQ